MKNILILGGSYAGLSTAHRILKKAAKADPFKITLVSPDTHLYWNMAAPRGVIPGQLADEKIFHPVAAGFEQYPASQFEFILATAESLDVEARKVEISGSTGSQTLSYDMLILATGSHTKDDSPFKGLGSTEATKKALHDFQERVKKAKTIVVAGAGLTGCETAGELGFEYGRQKKIVLIASGPTILEDSPPSVSKSAMKSFEGLNVDVKLQTKVKNAVPLPNGQKELILVGGEPLITDMYIPTFGLAPSSSYVPAKFLNANGFVVVDEYLQVKGAGPVWAIGDVCDAETPQFVHCDKQSAHLAKSMSAMLSNGTALPYKAATSPFMGLSIGKKAGTGHFGSMKIPSFVIVWARKNLFIENMRPTVNGSLF